MAYTLTYSLGTISVADTTLNSQTSLNLPGRNYAGYGSPVDQNQISLLESFASYPTFGPSNPIPGQTWFDTASGNFNVNTSANATASWSPVVLSGSSATVANLSVTGTAFISAISTGGAVIPGTMTGTWTLTAGSSLNATYADYAERFEADGEYEAGTVMEMGGEKEITQAQEELSESILGVVSSTAGMTMNAAAGSDSTHPKIAMAGRVPVKVRGAVRKGDRLVSAGRGYARAAKGGEANAFNTIGRSLENKLTEEPGQVLAAVSAKL